MQSRATARVAAAKEQYEDYPDKAVIAARATARVTASISIASAATRVAASTEDEQKDYYPEAIIIAARVEHIEISPFFYVTILA